MQKLNGTLDVTSLAEILRLCSVQQKTGALMLVRAGIKKTLYFHNGLLIYITSNKPGERVGEYLIQSGDLTRTWAGFLLKDSKRNGIAFTTSLLKKNIFEKTKLGNALSDVDNTVLADVLSWTNGSFEFSDKLPQQALDGPIRISEVQALQQLLQGYDVNPPADKTSELLRNVARKISSDNFSLPLLPNIMLKLEACWEDTAEDGQLLKIIRSDQVLSAFLLRVVNAAVDTKKHAATIKQAQEVYSVDHLIGVVHAQLACAQPPKHKDTVSQMSQHALRCACLAEQIAAQLGEDMEMAFFCGLFHNVGKVLLLQLLVDENVPDEQLPQLVTKYSQNTGALLSRRWNLGSVVHDCIKFCHQPQLARENQNMVEIIYLSHLLLLKPKEAVGVVPNCTHLRAELLNTTDLNSNLALIDEVVAAIY
jgi:HD-like signal output (HDOD) protein